MRCPADKKEAGGNRARQIGLRRDVARGDAVAEAVLQGDAQQRQGLRLLRGVLDTGAHRDLSRAGVVSRGSELAHVVGAEIPARHQRDAECRVEPGERLVKALVGGEIVTVVIHDLAREQDDEHRGSHAPPVAQMPAGDAAPPESRRSHPQATPHRRSTSWLAEPTSCGELRRGRGGLAGARCGAAVSA